MKRIWKFSVGLVTTHEMPKGAKFLSVQIQNGTPQMWFEVDESLPDEPRKFRLIGTGHTFEAGRYTYLGTVQSGEFVWHLYEDR